jgi:hypothetical protein
MIRLFMTLQGGQILHLKLRWVLRYRSSVRHDSDDRHADIGSPQKLGPVYVEYF